MACVNHHSYFHLLFIIKLSFHVILCVNSINYISIYNVFPKSPLQSNILCSVVIARTNICCSGHLLYISHTFVYY